MFAQELSPQDFAKRRDACNAILTIVRPGIVAWTSDEAHFHLSGTVNKQNVRYWPSENPCKLHQRPLHSPKVSIEGVIAGISQDILGRVAENFFERLNMCIARQGRHLDHIIFKTSWKKRYYMYF